jgi:putative ABC transport system substrate-binding protein
VRRRPVLRAFGAGTLIAWASAARGQAPGKVPRIAVLLVGPRESYVGSDGMALFRDRLRQLGYVEGKSILIEERYADGDAVRLAALAHEIVDSKADIIVTPTVAASTAARRATSTIPIVMVHAGNPVGAGLVASLARPGGNVTGTTNMLLGGKQIELLRELVPRLARLGVLINPTNAGAGPVREDMTDTARRLGIELVFAQVTSAEELSRALAMLRGSRLDGFTVMVEKVIVENVEQVLQFARSARLPASYDLAGVVEAGGLISYGPLLHEQYAFAAVYVDKILKGARPGDLPVQQPTQFELAINLKTAKALGLAVPRSLLLRADKVIE